MSGNGKRRKFHAQGALNLPLFRECFRAIQSGIPPVSRRKQEYRLEIRRSPARAKELCVVSHTKNKYVHTLSNLQQTDDVDDDPTHLDVRLSSSHREETSVREARWQNSLFFLRALHVLGTHTNHTEFSDHKNNLSRNCKPKIGFGRSTDNCQVCGVCVVFSIKLSREAGEMVIRQRQKSRKYRRTSLAQDTPGVQVCFRSKGVDGALLHSHVRHCYCLSVKIV